MIDLEEAQGELRLLTYMQKVHASSPELAFGMIRDVLKHLELFRSPGNMTTNPKFSKV